MELVHKKNLAFELRRTGRSYSEIASQLQLSKSTLSYWFSKDTFSIDVKQKLNHKWQADSRNRILLMNAERLRKSQLHHDEVRKLARIEFNDLKQDPLFRVGLSLYWGEGSKTNNGRVSVVNSDPDLLKIIVRFYRKTLKVPEAKIRAEMFIYQDLDEVISKKYWSDTLMIDTSQFIKTQVLPSKAVSTQKKLPYGFCTVYFSNTDMSIRILEWIKLLAKECGNSSVG